MHSSCPNSTEGGCRCPEHHPGLAVHAQDPAAYEAALARLRPTTLRIVTMPKDQPCTGTMTCPCEQCYRERSTPRKRGGLAAAQPWTPKPARHLRDAA